MKYQGLISIAVGGALLAGSSLLVLSRVSEAGEHLKQNASGAKPKAATANDANAAYCKPEFMEVLSRVIHACGLEGGESRRGCQPADVKTLASISDEDFNALFTPLKSRGAVVMFDDNSEKLDEAGQRLVEAKWKERGGGRYFFVVARASKTGTPESNRSLSHKRANSVLLDIADKTQDPEDKAQVDKQVGMLWLGSEFAQLGQDYCDWEVSRAGKCTAEAINRSAFVSWVDCQL